MAASGEGLKFVQLLPPQLVDNADGAYGAVAALMHLPQCWAPIYIERPCGPPMPPVAGDRPLAELKDEDGGVVGFQYSVPAFIGWAPYHALGYRQHDSRHFLNVNGAPYCAVFINVEVKLYDDGRESTFRWTVGLPPIASDATSIPTQAPDLRPALDTWTAADAGSADDKDGGSTIDACSISVTGTDGCASSSRCDGTSTVACPVWPAPAPLLFEDSDGILPVLPHARDASSCPGLLAHVEEMLLPPSCDRADSVVTDSSKSVSERRRAAAFRALHNDRSGCQFCIAVDGADASSWIGPRIAVKQAWHRQLSDGRKYNSNRKSFDALQIGAAIPADVVVAPVYCEYPVNSRRGCRAEISYHVINLWAPRDSVTVLLSNVSDSQLSRRILFGAEYVRCYFAHVWSEEQFDGFAVDLGLGAGTCTWGLAVGDDDRPKFHTRGLQPTSWTGSSRCRLGSLAGPHQ